jgi:hypothetical protein
VGWVIENLIGVKNGVNKDFTISSAPIPESLIIVHQATRLRSVVETPQPEEYHYAVSSTNIKLGRAPKSTEDIWVRYFF